MSFAWWVGLGVCLLVCAWWGAAGWQVLLAALVYVVLTDRWPARR